MRTTPWTNLTKLSATSTGNDKTFDVPSGHQYAVDAVWGQLVASSIAGNRQLDFSVYDSSDTATYNEVYRYRAGAVLSSASTGIVLWAPGHVNDTAFVGGSMLRTLGATVLAPAGYRLRLYDSAAVSTLDGVTAPIHVEDRIE